MRRRAMVMLGFFTGFVVFLAVGLFLVNRPTTTPFGFICIGLAVLMIILVLVYSIMGSVQPSWTKQLAQNGVEAKATVIENNALKGIGSYKGSDVWLDILVRVHPVNETAYEAQMKCRLSQAIMLREGTETSVRYDPSNKSRVVLIGDEYTNMMAKHLQ